MRSKDDLFHLIQAMSKSEKRYFSLDAKKSGKEGSRYLQLFQAINKMEVFEDTKLKKKFKNLSSDKAYLYEAILRSMRDYRSAKSKAAQVKERLMDSEYLYERGLYQQSQDRLQEAKELVLELQDMFALLEINVEETQFFVDTKRQIDNEGFERLDQEKQKTLAAIREEMCYLDLYFQLSIRVLNEYELKDEADKEKLRKEIHDLLLEPKEIPNSPRAQHRFYQCRAMYFRLIGEAESVYENFFEVVKWWDNHPALKSEEFHRYVVDVFNLVNACYQTGQHLDVAQDLQNKLKKEKENTSYNVQRMIFRKLSIANLLHLLNHNDFDNAAKLLPEIIEGMNKFGLKNSIVLTGNIMTVYFLVEDYTNCKEWCFKIIQNQQQSGRLDIQRIIRVYANICMFELGEIEALDSFRRSVQRYFRQMNVDTQSFDLQVHNIFLRKIFNAPVSEFKAEIKNMLTYLEAYSIKNANDSPVGLEELIIWCHKKLGTTP